MTVRSILSARSARPQVAGMLRGLVRAAVFLGRADGHLGEAEVERLIDGVRDFVVKTVGEEHLADLASTSRLLDDARAARAALRVDGDLKYLEELAAAFPVAFRRDALIAAHHVVTADGAITPDEHAAFGRLAAALGISPEELPALEVMAEVLGVSRDDDDAHLEEAVDHLTNLTEHGWRDASAELKGELRWFDGCVAHDGPAARLRLDLDARERVLHITVNGPNAPGPHIICLYGHELHTVLTLIDRVKDRLNPANVPQLLADLVVPSEALFLERDGRLVQVHPSPA